jgi:hypothetical protein
MTNMNGLKYLKPNDDGTGVFHVANWRAWPHGSVCHDLGSDILSMMHALIYGYKLNLSRLGNPQHGANNDVKVLRKGLQRWNLLATFRLF